MVGPGERSFFAVLASAARSASGTFNMPLAAARFTRDCCVGLFAGGVMPLFCSSCESWLDVRCFTDIDMAARTIGGHVQKIFS